MYCINCGTQLSESASFCPACGNGIRQPSQSAPQSAGLRGFSTRISDPAFAKYVKNTNRWSAIFSTILAIAAVIGFYIAGETGAEGMSNPESIYIGFGNRRRRHGAKRFQWRKNRKYSFSPAGVPCC